MAKRLGFTKVRFDQCAAGLSMPTAAEGELVRKHTTVLTNAPLESLAKRCTGCHPHTALTGSIKVRDQWLSRSAFARAYPFRLFRK